MQTFMPARAKAIAAASPMPEAPPVTTATLFGDIAGSGIGVLRFDQERMSSSSSMAYDGFREPAWVFAQRRWIAIEAVSEQDASGAFSRRSHELYACCVAEGRRRLIDFPFYDAMAPA
jgi:hypothetical protein